MKAILAGALVATATLSALPMAVPAQQRERVLIIYGNDPCPTSSSGDEIVVCARRPENERYRIPPETVQPGDNDPQSRSWEARARTVDALSGPGVDAVESCSTVGQGGQTGCLKEMIDNSRVGIDADNPTKPPEG